MLQFLSNPQDAPVPVKPTGCSSYSQTHRMLQLLSNPQDAPVPVKPTGCSNYCAHNHPVYVTH